ncbi:hypothetical protein V2J09_024067 [Rumex salicifolius]
MSTATTATSIAATATHLLNTKQQDSSSNLKIVSNGELLNGNNNSEHREKKTEELQIISQDSISSVEEDADAEAFNVDSPGKSDPDSDLPLGPQISLKEQIDMDKDDASLRKWKEQLLGSIAVNGEAISKEAEVKILRQTIQFNERADIVRTTPYEATSPKSPLFTLKEGCKQQANFEFVVSNNIVCGLKYICEVWKKGIKVNHTKKMVGTFAPREEPYKFVLDQATIPCGFFVRGTYVCRTRFVDDDGKCHFDATYYFEIQKNWGNS